MYFLLSRTQAEPGRTVKQEQEQISRNHVQTFSGCSVHALRRVPILILPPVCEVSRRLRVLNRYSEGEERVGEEGGRERHGERKEGSQGTRECRESDSHPSSSSGAAPSKKAQSKKSSLPRPK